MLYAYIHDSGEEQLVCFGVEEVDGYEEVAVGIDGLAYVRHDRFYSFMVRPFYIGMAAQQQEYAYIFLH